MRYGITLALTTALVLWLLAGATDMPRLYLVVIDLLGAGLLVASSRSAGIGFGARHANSGIALLCLVALLPSLFGELDVARFTTGIVILLVAVRTPMLILRGVLRRRTVDVQIVMAAVTVYLLLGIAGSMALVVLADPQSSPVFSIGSRLEDGSFRDKVYFSFITLSTVGYGDITPHNDTARAIAIGTALVGQLYLVTAVATTMSVLTSKRVDDGAAG